MLRSVVFGSERAQAPLPSCQLPLLQPRLLETRSPWRVTSAGKTGINSGEIWTAKSAFFVGHPSVDLWFVALGNRSVSPCSGPKPHLRSPTFGPEIRNSSSSVRRQFGDNPEGFERKAWIGEESRCDVQTLEGLLSWCLGEHRPQPCETISHDQIVGILAHRESCRAPWRSPQHDSEFELPVGNSRCTGIRPMATAYSKKSTRTGFFPSSPSQKQRLSGNPNRKPIGEQN